MKQVLTELYKIIPFIGIYFALFTILFPSSIISFIFGEKWLYLAGFPLSLLTFGYIFLLLANLLGTVALGLGKIRERLKILTIIGTINIILDALFIWKMGILGSVIMDSLIAIALVFTFTYMIKNHVKFKIPFQFYTEIALFSILIFASVRYLNLKPVNFLELVFYGFVYSAIFLLYGYYAKIYSKTTINLLMPKAK